MSKVNKKLIGCYIFRIPSALARTFGRDIFMVAGDVQYAHITGDTFVEQAPQCDSTRQRLHIISHLFLSQESEASSPFWLIIEAGVFLKLPAKEQ